MKAGAIGRSFEAVFGAQDQGEPHPWSATQEIDVAATQTIHAGLVREQRHTLAGHETDRIRQEHFDARPHLGGRGPGAREYAHQRETMRTHRLLVVALVLGCGGARTGGGSGRPPAFPSPAAPVTTPALPPSPTQYVDSILAHLSARQRVAQLVVPWLPGSYTALDDSLFGVAARWVDSLEVGGLIISVGSPFDIAAKLNALQRRSRLPLLVSADLEWGAPIRVIAATAFPQIMPDRPPPPPP